MKRTVIIIITSLMLMPIFAQVKYEFSKESTDSKCKDLITQLNVLIIFGQQYAKSHGMTAAQYGQYVAEQYIKQGWAEGGNFEGLTDACLYNLSCFMSDSEIEIINKTPEMVVIKSAMINGLTRRDEPCFLITGKDYLDYFTTAMKTIAKNGGCNYKVETQGELVYTTISKN